MKKKSAKNITLCALTILIAGCSLTTNKKSVNYNKVWKTIPPWAGTRIQQNWWRQYNDTNLNQDITNAFSNNPDLAIIAARLQRAEALVKKTRAASLPSLNLGIGHRDGRKQEIDFGPYNLAPWENSAQFSWEIDLSGRLRATTRSARLARDAAFWDLHAARLQLASRIAATRFNIYRLNTEVSLLQQSTHANQKIVNSLKARADAGIIATTGHRRQQAEHEKLRRQIMDIRRVRDLAAVQLRTLTGGQAISGTTRERLPVSKKTLTLPLKKLLTANPTLLAAEARVRSALQLEKSARLDLLPSFRLQASAAGAGRSLTTRYKIWQHQVGPSLDIPIYDPSRMATIKVRRAEVIAASAKYRAAVLSVLEEVQSAYINLQSRQGQLQAAKREISALSEARVHAASQFQAGITSQIEYLDTERSWLEAKRTETALRQALLNDHIQLIKATGGGNS